MNEENKNQQTESQGMGIEQIIDEMREKNMADDQILAAIEQMAKEGKIAQEDIAKAQEYLKKANGDEKADAEKMFGMKFID